MTTAATVASPVDFETYGDYSAKAPPRADGAFVRPRVPLSGPDQRGRVHRVPR